MKITLFRDMQAEGWRSMGRYYASLYKHLSKICLERSSTIEVFDTEPPIKSSKVKLFWRSTVYPHLAKRQRADVNHVLDHSYAHLLNYLNPEKTVVTCHDIIPLFCEKDEVIKLKFRKVVENLKKAAFIIADSKSTKNDLVNALDISEEKVGVIYLGVDPIFSVCNSVDELSRIRDKYKIPDGKIILSHGNDLNYKNVVGIFKTFQKILNSGSVSYLVRVGPLNNSLRKLAWDLGITDSIFELNDPDDKDLAVIYNLSDVFFSPSFKEGFGLPVLQSLACGTPVVISKNTSLQEIAGDFGNLVDPNNIDEMTSVILSILEKDDFKNIHKAQYIKKAQMFTWKLTAQKTFEVYSNLIK